MGRTGSYTACENIQAGTGLTLLNEFDAVVFRSHVPRIGRICVPITAR